jgi:2-phosphosulfolactate phosphatase
LGTFDQSEFAVRFEWGLSGLNAIGPLSDVVVIVDVLSFTTAVSISVDRGAIVFPYDAADDSAEQFSRDINAVLAVPRSRTRPDSPYSLSPESMLTVKKDERVVLPSPNGSRLSFAAQKLKGIVLAGCLRNASAVAATARSIAPAVAVVAAGERWTADGGLRPALEDMLGAGAIIRALPGTRSPEAQAAATTFDQFADGIQNVLTRTASGKELAEAGYPGDVKLAGQLDVTDVVPYLSGNAFTVWKA